MWRQLCHWHKIVRNPCVSLPLAKPRGSAATVQHKHMQHKPYINWVALFTGNLKQRNGTKVQIWRCYSIISSTKRVWRSDWIHVGHGSVVSLDDHGNEHWDPQKSSNFMTMWASISFTRATLIPELSCEIVDHSQYTLLHSMVPTNKILKCDAYGKYYICTVGTTLFSYQICYLQF
jgi:hypothetical protein